MECPALRFVYSLILFTSLGFQNSDGQSYSLQMYHKYSHEVREWMTWRHGLDADDWPVVGSNEYYSALSHHDSARHGRKLADYSSLTFSEGNKTLNLPELGFLFYTVVQVGTPQVTLLVALDTGSDLFWVPCDCQSCVSTSAASNITGINLQTYSPSNSRTSNSVACSNVLCSSQNKCSSSSDQCPYSVTYLSADTSTAGTLVEDILYLIPGDGSQSGTVVNASITFGCGKVQTGSFLQGPAPDGLLGLGIANISVPSILYSSGLVSNSFSMCFPYNSSVGRFTFGDKGSSGQKETNFIQTAPTYYVNVTGFYVGNASDKTGFQALFDTGTSFTQLADSVYKSLTSNYNLQTSDSRLATDYSNIPFEFCYKLSNSQSTNQGPNITFNFDGGNNFSVIQPLIFVQYTNDMQGYCLAVLNGSDTSIIGQNFMTGYQLVFDREQHKLGWKEDNCYTSTSTNFTNSSTGSPPNLSTSHNTATLLSLSFLPISLSFSFALIILTILF